MMSKFQIVLSVICGIVVLIVLAFALELGGLQWKMFFEPKHEAVRREVFKQTRSYNEGKEQELIKYRLEYMKADDEGKLAIASAIRHSFADYDETLLSGELKLFLRKVKYGN